jgi:hypothetical protein
VRGVGGRLKRVALALVLVAASTVSGLFATVSTAHATPTCVVTEILVNTCRPWLGAAAGTYPDLASDLESQIAGHEARIGRAVDVVHLYHPPGSRPLSVVDRYYATRANTTAFINWKPAVSWRDADGSNPSVNAEIDAVADDIKSLGSTKILLTLHHEPEDDVSGGASGCTTYKGSAGTPADYRAMWRNVRERFNARGVTNAVFVMNYMGFSQWDCMVDDLWPGDDLVDWVVWDPYSESQSFSATIGRFYHYLEASADATHDYTSKAWGLGEWGVWGGASQAFTYQYYDDARASIAADEFPRLKLYSIFDHGVTAPGTSRIGYDSNNVWDQSEVDHYRALANDPVFLGSSVPGPVPPGPVPPGPVPAPVPVPAPGPADAPPPFGPPLPNDQVPPTAPGALTVVSNSPTRVMLQWQPAVDDGTVAAYLVVRDGAILGVSFAHTTYEDLMVLPSTAYTYSVMAFDDMGNLGPPTADLAVVTPALPGIQPSTTPTNLRAASSAGGGVSLTWAATTTDIPVHGYAVYQGAVYVGTSSSTNFVVTGLRTGASYMFTVRAVDAAGNVSGPSNLVAARAG